MRISEWFKNRCRQIFASKSYVRDCSWICNPRHPESPGSLTSPCETRLSTGGFSVFHVYVTRDCPAEHVLCWQGASFFPWLCINWSFLGTFLALGTTVPVTANLSNFANYGSLSGHRSTSRESRDCYYKTPIFNPWLFVSRFPGNIMYNIMSARPSIILINQFSPIKMYYLSTISFARKLWLGR